MIKQIDSSLKDCRIPGRIFVQEQIEADISGPLDSRTLVPKLENLTSVEWWTDNYRIGEYAAGYRLMLYKGMVVKVSEANALYMYTGESTYLGVDNKDFVGIDNWKKLTIANSDDVEWPLHYESDVLRAGHPLGDGFILPYKDGDVDGENAGNLYIGRDFVSLGSNMGYYLDGDGGSFEESVQYEGMQFYPDIELRGSHLERGLYIPTGQVPTSTSETAGELRNAPGSNITLLSGDGTGIRLKDDSTAISMSDYFIAVDSSNYSQKVHDFEISQVGNNNCVGGTVKMRDSGILIDASAGMTLESKGDVAIDSRTKVVVETGGQAKRYENIFSDNRIELRVADSSATLDSSGAAFDVDEFIVGAESKADIEVWLNCVQLLKDECFFGYDYPASPGGIKVSGEDSTTSHLNIQASDVSVQSRAAALDLSGDGVNIWTNDKKLRLWGKNNDQGSFVHVVNPMVDDGTMPFRLPLYSQAAKQIYWQSLEQQHIGLLYSNTAGQLGYLTVPDTSYGVFCVEGGELKFEYTDKDTKMVLQYTGSGFEWTDQLFGSQMSTAFSWFSNETSTENRHGNGTVYTNTETYYTGHNSAPTTTKVGVAAGSRKQYIKVATYTLELKAKGGNAATWNDMQLVMSIGGRENTGVYSVDVRFANCSKSTEFGVTTDIEKYRGYARIRQESASQIFYDNASVNKCPEVIGTIEYFSGTELSTASPISYDNLVKTTSTESYFMVFTLYAGVNDAICSWNVLSKAINGGGELEVTATEKVKGDGKYSYAYAGTYFADFVYNKVRQGYGELACVEKCLAINYGHLTKSDAEEFSSEYDAYAAFWSNANPGCGLAEIPAPPVSGQGYGLMYHPANGTEDAYFEWENTMTKTISVDYAGSNVTDDTKVKMLGAIVADDVTDPGIVNTYFSNSVYFNKDGNMYATAYFALSDEREKTNIEGIAEPGDIKPRQFDYAATGRRAYGFVAQEVEKTNPELVTTDSNGMKRVDYNSALTLYAASLERRIETLEARLAWIEAKLSE